LHALEERSKRCSGRQGRMVGIRLQTIEGPPHQRRDGTRVKSISSILKRGVPGEGGIRSKEEIFRT